MTIVEKRFETIQDDLDAAVSSLERKIVSVKKTILGLKPSLKRRERKEDEMSFNEVQEIDTWNMDTLKKGPFKFKVCGAENQFEVTRTSSDVDISIWNADGYCGSSSLSWEIVYQLCEWLKEGPHRRSK